MAGTPIQGEKVTIFQEDVDFSSANSEALQTKIAKAAVFASDTTEFPVQFTYAGYFRSNFMTTGANRYIVTKRSTLKRFVLSVGQTGSGTANILNAKVYDADGVFINNLFTGGAAPSILSPATRVNSYVGYNVDESSSIEGNVAGATIVYGTPNVIIFEAGWQIIGEIDSNASNAYNADLTLTFQRLE